MTRPVRLLVSAGERSGDLRAGALVAALKERMPDVELRGLGGERLAACGLTSEVPIESLAVMGFVEVIRHLPFFARLLNVLTGVLRSWQPDRVLLV
ncbi:MAG: lipid-A-disaccharide synthase, partial [Candidatus Eisenbacteria bacterium]|nr:lipid-A-disaccharide synthase [Candidatus Eisenbacteria bacterium]